MQKHTLFFTDWEGPWITTDFALEVSKDFLNNATFFERLSQYDDYLYFIAKKEGYRAGDTLKLLAPFICAKGISSKELEKLAIETANFVKDAKSSITILQKKYTAVVISTSYDQYLKATAKKLGVKGFLHGTEFDVEKLAELFDSEDEMLAEKLIEKISKLPEISLDFRNRRVNSEAKKSIEFLNDVFFENRKKIRGFEKFIEKLRAIMKRIDVVGGNKKLEVLKSYSTADRIIAIGDSISDCEMLDYVRKKGLAVSFNGNEYSLMKSNLAIVSDSTFAEAAVVDAFLGGDIEGVVKMIESFKEKRFDEVEKYVDKDIVEGLKEVNSEFYWVKKAKFDVILSRSRTMRKAVRGEAGKLG